MEEENPETELRRLFDSYDSDGSGELSKAEVAAALEDLNLPLTYVEQIFGLIDANQDGSLSFEEFQSYVAATEQELRDLFDLIDVDRSGGITYDELLSSLTQMRLAPDPQRVKQMMAKMDADSSGEISFSEFKHIFALLRPVDLVALYNPTASLFELSSAAFMSDLRVALGRFQPRPLSQDKDASPITAAQWGDGMRMTLGGLSAVMAQLFCQPIETVKVRLQNEASAAGATRKYGNIVKGFGVLVREVGFLALYKGMAPSTLRELSYSTLRFGLYKPIKDFVGALGPQQQLHPLARPPPEPFWKKLLAGGLAGGIGSAISNPADLLKARMQADSSARPMTMTQHFQQIIAHDGVRGLWKGTSTTVTRAVILGATKLASYDEIKTQLNRRLNLDPKGFPSIISASVGAGLLVTLTTAPPDFCRTRLMTANQMAKQTGLSVQYKSGFDVARQVLRSEGPGALYKGWGSQWARIAPYSILQFLAWEQLCHLVGLDAV